MPGAGSSKKGAKRAGAAAAAAKRGATKKDSVFGKAQKAANHVQTQNKLLEILSRRPHLGEKILDFAEQAEREWKDSVENDLFPRNYYRIRQAGVNMMIAIMMSFGVFNEREWLKMRSQPPLSDRDTVSAMERLFYFVCGCMSEDPICANRRVFKYMMRQRHLRFGSRLAKVRLAEGTGWVDWQLSGFYSLQLDADGKVEKVIHVSGKEAKPSNVMLAFTGWVIYNNWDCEQACARLPDDSTSINLMRLFKEKVVDPEVAELEEAQVSEFIDAVKAEQEAKSSSSNAAPAGRPPLPLGDGLVVRG